MFKSKKVLALFCTLLLAINVLVGCGSDKTSKETAMRIGVLYEQDKFNVMSSLGAFGNMTFVGFQNAPFVTKGVDGKPAPYFMKSWKFSEDGMSMTFKFPDNVEFHDGKKVTADDVKFSIDFAVENVSFSVLADYVKSCEIIDATTAKLNFKKPAGIGFLKGIEDLDVVIPKHVWKDQGKDHDKYNEANAAIGCGPYKLVNVDKDAQISYYEAMPNYFYGNVTVPKVEIKTYNDINAVLMALENNEIDTYYQYSTPMDSSMAPAIEKSKNIKGGLTDTSATYQLSFGANSYPSNDVEFRKAVSYIVDWDKMASVVGDKNAVVGTIGAIPPISDAYDENSPKLVKDLNKAKEILDAAGYVDKDGDGFRENSKGEPMEIVVMPHYSKSTIELRVRLCEVLVKSLNEAGIKSCIEEKSVGNKEYSWPLIKSGEYDIAITYTTTGKADFETAYFYFLNAFEDSVFGHFDIPEMKSYVDKLRTAKTNEEYVEGVKGLEKLNEKYVLGLPLAYEKVFWPYNERNFDGWEFREGVGVIHSGTWFKLKAK